LAHQNYFDLTTNLAISDGREERRDMTTPAAQNPTASTPKAQLKSGELAGSWTLDPARSTAAIASKSMWGLVSVKGVFRDVEGSGTVTPDGAVTGRIDLGAESIDTKNAKRDKHLRSDDFFLSEKFPKITFTLDRLAAEGDGVTATGAITVRDRTQPVSFPATVTQSGDGEVALDATLEVDRSQFGLTWNQLGMASMKNAITVHAVFTRS
jgi:polyisoprenoid-binding protein YceI